MPALIVEVAQSGLPVARGRKAAAYARVLEVHREAARTGPARRRWGYGAIDALGADATVTPLAAPAATICVADLLPQPRTDRQVGGILATPSCATSASVPEA